MLPSTLYTMWPVYLQSLKLFCPTVNEELHLQENYIYKKIHYLTYDIDFGIKVTHNVDQNPLHNVTSASAKF